MLVRRNSGGPQVDRSLWERAYQYILIQYPDPITAKDFLMEAWERLELSLSSRMKRRKGKGWTLTRDQGQATQTRLLTQPSLYATPEPSMPSAAGATRGGRAVRGMPADKPVP
jgi:hypothetical protein